MLITKSAVTLGRPSAEHVFDPTEGALPGDRDVAAVSHCGIVDRLDEQLDVPVSGREPTQST